MFTRNFLRVIIAIGLITFFAACTPTPSAIPLPTAQPTALAIPASPIPQPIITALLPTPTATTITIPPTPTLKPITLDDRKNIFEQVWATVRDKYVYTDFRGVDWQKVHDEFAPKVAATTTSENFYDLMRDLIKKLGDDTSYFMDPREVTQDDQYRSYTAAWGGIGAAINDDGRITLLFKNAPAEAAGLKRFEIIKTINGIPYTDTRAFGASGPIMAIRGPIGSSVNLAIQSFDGKTRAVEIKRAAISASSDLDAPEIARLAGTQVGILTIKNFYANDLDTQIKTLIQKLSEAGSLEGLIVDVRMSGAGPISMMSQTLGLFLEGGSIGNYVGRDFKQDVLGTRNVPIAQLKDVPIIVLTSRYTVGISEIFIAGMQSRKRVRVVGTSSGGFTNISNKYNFSDGSRLWLEISVYRLPDGTSIQGRGVQPDRVVEPKWDVFGTMDDPQIQAALEELKKK